MRKHLLKLLLLLIAMGIFYTGEVSGQRKVEKLGRGVIALNKGGGQVYIGWRMLGTDPADIAFNLYHSIGGAAAVKIAGPITQTTDYTATGIATTSSNSFFVKPIINGVEQAASAPFVLPANAPTRHYLAIPQQYEPDGGPYTTWQVHVGDVDGDGEYEYVCMRSYAGTTAPTARTKKIDCYKLDGTLLWRLDLGVNFDYTANDAGSLVVADFDGNGKDEVMLRTFEGTCFRYGASDSARIGDENHNGKILGINTEPEFLSVLEGATGKELARTLFEPSNGGDGWVKYGPNERPYYVYTAVAYLDGVLPSFVSVRGVGQGGLNTYAAAFDYRNGTISKRWQWAPVAGDYISQAHNILVYDLDNDGKDEISFLGSALDDNGTILYQNKDFWHGDHYRVLDMDPDRPGYEIFSISQGSASNIGMSVIDGATGEYIKKWFLSAPGDVSRGDAGDYEASSKGAECMSTMGGLYDIKGNTVADNRFPTWGIWWDSDIQRELIVGSNAQGTSPAIEKWSTGRLFSIHSDDGQWSNHIPYGGHPQFWGDIMGDWREEMITEENDYTDLRLYSTWDPAINRLYTLMDNPGYKGEVTCKGRIGGAFPDYYLGGGMQTPPPPPIVDAKLHWKGNAGNNTWDINTTTNWLNNNILSTFNQNDTVLFDLTGINSAPIILTGTLTPGKVTVYNPINYTFSGTGDISGSTSLTKVGKGTLTLNNKNTYTGKTEVWDGAFVVNDSLLNSDAIVYGGTWGGALSKGLTGGRIGGRGHFGNVTLEYGGAIVPGQGVGFADTITIDTLIEKIATANFIDFSNDPTGLTHKNDMINVIGSLTIADGITVSINIIDGGLSPGVYTIFKYSGTFTGNIDKIKIVGLDEYTYTVVNQGGVIGISISAQRPSAKVVWAGNGNNWDLGVSSNWLRNGNSDVFASRDSVLFDNTGAAKTTVNIPKDLYVNEMIFDGTTNYTISGSGAICGSGKLTKKGTSVVRLNGQHKFTGATTIEGGTLEIASINDGNEPSSIGASASSVGNLQLSSGGCLGLISGSCSTHRPITINNGEGVFSSISGSSMVLLGVISGNGTLVKKGPGVLQLNGANTFSGGVIAKEGTISLLGSFAPNTLVTFMGGTLNVGGATNWNISVPDGYTGYINSNGSSTFTGTLTGGGTLSIYVPYVRDVFSGNWSAFTGTINLTTDADGGQCRLYSNNGYAKATFNLATAGVTLFYDYGQQGNNGAQSVALGGLSGIAGTYLSDEAWVIGSNNKNTTFAGVISGNSLTKVGTGTLTLSGANTYSGGTTVNAGTLFINNTTGSGTGVGIVKINTGGTLAGTGIISGAVTIANGGTIAPGNNGVGTLVVKTNLVLAAGSTTAMEVNKSPLASDTIRLTGSLTYNGTLAITNISALAFAAGESYKLFKAASYKGLFTAITPSIPGDGLVWDTTDLRTNGTIKVKTTQSVGFNVLTNKTVGQDIVIAPNPVTENLTVTFGNLGTKSTIEIYSMGGVLLYKQKVIDKATLIPMGQFQPGLYIIKVTSQEDIVIKQIIKQ